MICAPTGSPPGVRPMGAATAGKPGNDACDTQKVWSLYGRSPSGVVIVRSSKGLESCGKAGVKFTGHKNTSISLNAGMRMEPTRSDPYSRNVIPADNAAAVPPEEPPGVRVVSHGLLVTP